MSGGNQSGYARDAPVHRLRLWSVHVRTRRHLQTRQGLMMDPNFLPCTFCLFVIVVDPPPIFTCFYNSPFRPLPSLRSVWYNATTTTGPTIMELNYSKCENEKENPWASCFAAKEKQTRKTSSTPSPHLFFSFYLSSLHPNHPSICINSSPFQKENANTFSMSFV